jgi:glycosyltransferase involved in cell wall biosynthesis
MQEIKKRRIVIASVLKPVDDSRMFEKIGISLAPFYEVDIIGYPSVKHTDSGGIRLHPLANFHRLSLARILAPFSILRKVLKHKPDLLIISTHELILTALLVKWFAGARVVYDVRENYRRNVLYTAAFPRIWRPVLAGWIAAEEWIARSFVDHYLLAEKGYMNELHFPAGRFTVLENKFRKPPEAVVHVKKNRDTLELLFSGTLSESTGVFIAIELARKIHELLPTARLTIIGYCAQQEILDTIRSTIEDCDFITLKGGDRLVPHDEIIKAVQQSDFGIISYPVNPSTVNTLPTKLYEYMGCKLPILLINHPPWVAIASQYRAAIVFDSENLDTSKIMAEIQKGIFYTSEPVDIFWEEGDLLTAIRNILC